MKQLAVPFQQLVQRRLWPLALLLVAAAAAVPFLLAQDPSAPAPSSTVPATPGAQDDTTPIVALADDARIETERHVLGAPKDPFRPAVEAKAARTPDPDRVLDRAGDPPAPAPTATKADDGGSTPAPTGGTTPTAPPAEPPVATPTPAPPKPTYPLYSLVARFGAVGEAKERRLVLRSTGLPSNARVGLIYKGVLPNRRTAVFWVVRGTEVDGDGKCLPGPENCQYVQIDPGETLFLTLPNGTQYQLDLLRVHAGRADAKGARAQASSALPKRVRDGAGRYRYDWRTGVLDAVSRRELQAAAAQASSGIDVD
jgi:hypothetical protein